ncbi:MAG: serine/threonine protein kinase, partial [Deltaproteobacteria bacterium]|nr:serine/threonine protein kinase [Deltaproteobacteria bacterium]
MEPRLPQNFGRYILRERVGRGGMAEVFRASLPGFGGFEKPVAIKRMFREFSHDASFVEMLNDEAKIVSQLAHPNIVQILDVGRVGDEYYIAFEYLEGVDLFSVLQRHHEEQRDLPAGLACYIVAELCSALDYAHSRHTADGKPLGIIHRDVSPQNVLLSLVGEVKLTDFGIAKAAYRYTQTQAGLIKGKIYYMSPEQVLGQELDHRSDLFAAGILLFECLTTRPLYDEPDQKRLLDRVSRAQMTWPTDKVGRVPPALRQVVEKALQARPADRYATGKEMRAALTTAAHDLGLRWEREQLGAYLRQMYSVAEDRPPDVRVHERLVHPERHDARWNSQVDAKAHREEVGDEATWRDPALPPRLPSWGPAGPKLPPPRTPLAQAGTGARETAPPPLPTPAKAAPPPATAPSPPAKPPAPPPPQAALPPPMPGSPVPAPGSREPATVALPAGAATG